MEVLKWKDSEIHNQFSSCHCLGEIISQLESAAAARGEVVCEVHVNGMFLSEDDEKRLATSLIEEISELEIIFKKPEDLLFEALDSYLEFIPKLKEESQKCSEHLRQFDLKLGQMELGRFLDGCRWLTDAICLLRERLQTQTSVEHLMKKWEFAEHGYIEAIGELIKAFDLKDYVLLADLLEYDVYSSLQTWQELLDKMRIFIHKSKTA